MTFPVLDRRRFFTWTGILGTLGSRFGSHRLMAAPPTNVYTRIGLTPIINASGAYTHLGGSLMPPEVLDAMNEAARQYVLGMDNPIDEWDPNNDGILRQYRGKAGE